MDSENYELNSHFTRLNIGRYLGTDRIEIGTSVFCGMTPTQKQI